MSSLTGNIHTGILNDNLKTRILVLYKQNPYSLSKSLVAKIDAIKGDILRQEVMIVASSSEAQNRKDLAEVLDSKGFLKTLHETGSLLSVDIDDVIMTPVNGREIPLREIINAMNANAGMAPLPTKDELEAMSTMDPNYRQKQNELLDVDNRKSMAKNLMFQANMLQVEANKKFEQAYEFDYTLRPKAHVQPIAAQIVTPTVEAKPAAKRGRPAKAKA